MRNLILAGVSVAALLGAPLMAMAVPAKAHMVKAAAQAFTNPMLAPWTGPYGGYPRFDKVRVADFKPALEEAMALNRREIAAIADNPAPPTFKNTIEALERAGQPLGRVQLVYSVWAANLSTPDFQKVQDEMDPKLAAFKTPRRPGS